MHAFTTLFFATALLGTTTNAWWFSKNILGHKKPRIALDTPAGAAIFARLSSPTHPHFPRPLSPLAAKIFSAVVDIALKRPDQTAAPVESLPGAGRYIRDVVNYGTTPTHCSMIHVPEILRAREEVLVVVYLLDWQSTCGRLLAQAMRTLNDQLEGSGRRVRFYLVVSTISMIDYGRHSWTTRWRVKSLLNRVREVKSTAFAFPKAADVPNLDLRIKTAHRWFLGAVHSKLLVVDGYTLVSGSKNLDAETAHEYAFVVSGTIAESARMDFANIWREPLPQISRETMRAMDRAPVDDGASGLIPMFAAGRVSSESFLVHSNNNPQNQAWLAALANAQASVYIESPTFITRNIVDAAIAAARRGVQITVVTSKYMGDEAEMMFAYSYGSNRRMAHKVYEQLRNEPATAARFRVCWFIGKRIQPPRAQKQEWTHVKAMIVDEQVAIVGSGNIDPQSAFHSMEYNLVMDDAAVAARIRASLLQNQVSLQHCEHE